MSDAPKVKISIAALAKKKEEMSLTDKLESARGKHLRAADRFDQLKRMKVYVQVEEMIVAGWTIREVADFMLLPENKGDLEKLDVRTKRSIEGRLS